ncbi:MAG: DNA polymerase III subunit delta, partial [bacterium]|nr:DNA polymerase III subunit delta [bacterium]
KFEFLTGQKLRSWIQKKFSEYGSRISSDAEQLLIESVGGDLWRLNNEIQKLCLYEKGIGVEREDVKLMVRPTIEADIFKTINALAERDKKLALRLIYRHLIRGESPIYLLSMINYQFRNLLIIKDLMEKAVPYGAIAKRAGLHPFVVKKTFYQCQRFKMQDLKKIYLMIFQADLEVKTGKIQPEAMLETLILQV